MSVNRLGVDFHQHEIAIFWKGKFALFQAVCEPSGMKQGVAGFEFFMGIYDIYKPMIGDFFCAIHVISHLQ